MFHLFHFEKHPLSKSAAIMPTKVRPVVNKKDLDEEYRQMAADKVREAEARKWCEALIGDVANEARMRRREEMP